jgi:hypothetical protein
MRLSEMGSNFLYFIQARIVKEFLHFWKKWGLISSISYELGLLKNLKFQFWLKWDLIPSISYNLGLSRNCSFFIEMGSNFLHFIWAWMDCWRITPFQSTWDWICSISYKLGLFSIAPFLLKEKPSNQVSSHFILPCCPNVVCSITTLICYSCPIPCSRSETHHLVLACTWIFSFFVSTTPNLFIWIVYPTSSNCSYWCRTQKCQIRLEFLRNNIYSKV